MSAKKILLELLFSNGDCLYATAIARQIKSDFPGAHLTWAVAPFCKDILAGNPYIDAILEVPDVPKKDIVAYRKFKKRIRSLEAEGVYDKVFFCMASDDNQAYYDGCIRTNILNAYPYPITEGIQPVLRFSSEEREKVDKWVREKGLGDYSTIILFEFAPQSGQLDMTKERAQQIAETLCRRQGVAIIMSSALKIESSNPAVIDGSELSYRESIYLSHYCTLLLGCSSGITWGITSDGGKLLPMVQLLNPWTTWVNPLSRDFRRQGLPLEGVIELIRFDQQLVIDCVHEVIANGPSVAREKYNQQVPLHFRTTRKIVYNLLCYLQFRAILKHIRVNIRQYGWNPEFILAVLTAIFGFPFTLYRNRIRKRNV